MREKEFVRDYSDETRKKTTQPTVDQKESLDSLEENRDKIICCGLCRKNICSRITSKRSRRRRYRKKKRSDKSPKKSKKCSYNLSRIINLFRCKKRKHRRDISVKEMPGTSKDFFTDNYDEESRQKRRRERKEKIAIVDEQGIPKRKRKPVKEEYEFDFAKRRERSRDAENDMFGSDKSEIRKHKRKQQHEKAKREKDVYREKDFEAESEISKRKKKKRHKTERMKSEDDLLIEESKKLDRKIKDRKTQIKPDSREHATGKRKLRKEKIFYDILPENKIDFRKTCCYLCAQNTLAIATAISGKVETSDDFTQVSVGRLPREKSSSKKRNATKTLARTKVPSTEEIEEINTPCPAKCIKHCKMKMRSRKKKTNLFRKILHIFRPGKKTNKITNKRDIPGTSKLTKCVSETNTQYRN